VTHADSADFVVTLSRALRRAGVPVTPDRSVVAAGALATLSPQDRQGTYWATRLAFLASHQHVPMFNRVFAGLVDGLEDPAEARGDPNAPPPVGAEAGERKPIESARQADLPGTSETSPWASPSADQEPDSQASPRETALAAASPDERLSQRSFDDLTPQELADVRHLMARLRLTPPLRRSRRARRSPHGRRLDVRATLRRSIRAGDYPTRLAWRKRRHQPRQLAVICDISGSMEPYARAYLQFLQSAVGGGRAEAFVFATRLTRLTRVLRRAPAVVALQRAAEVAPDWSSGTRIAEALHAFNRGSGGRGLGRGAVVVILSDGWEVGDPEAVGREMAALKRLAYRVIWVNPHKASPRFEPLTGGMAAALPHCDAFVSGHTLAAMREVAVAIADSRQTAT
jgi:uncharacterized protein